MTEKIENNHMKETEKKNEHVHSESHVAVKNEEKKTENVVKEKSKEVKKTEVKKIKKEEAVAKGNGLHVSKKVAVYICRFIKGKNVDTAIADLRSVTKLKKAVPYKGEIPHRRGKGMMSGRFPVKAAGIFITILKGLKGNIAANGLELEKTKIYYASANWATRPRKSGNRLGKRTNLVLKAKEFVK